MVGAYRGLFRRDGDDLIPIGADAGIGTVVALHESGGELLIGATRGLFRRVGDDLVQIGADADTGSVRAFHESGGELLIGAESGLFRRAGDDLVPIGADADTGRHWAFYESGGELLARTENGLFRLTRLPWAEAEIAKKVPRDVRVGVPTVFTWEVAHPCGFTLTPPKIRAIPEASITLRQAKTDAGVTTISASIDFPEKRTFEIMLLAEEEHGESVALGGAISVPVGWTLPDYAKYYGGWAAAVFTIAHTAIFLVLIAGSRWSAFCWRVLTDPVWGKVGLWFYFALRHFGPMQRWVMAPWFQVVREKTRHQPYMPMSLRDDKGTRVARTTELLDPKLKWQRLWLQGNAGMGKTAVVLYLQALFFADPDRPTLGKAFARYRTVPIVVPLREYRNVAFDPGHPEDWVPSVARMAVSAYGVPFEDHGLFRAMIRSGGFLLILDGANEVERDEEIELFARSAPAARVLVTSQMPGSNYFTNWRLPHAIEIGSLLRLWLGKEKGAAVFARIEPTPLVNAIRSGYDVRLIADAVEDRGADVTLPEDRLGLYRLILDAIQMPNEEDYPEERQMADEEDYPVERLCKAAWEMWCDGERKVEAGKQLDQDLIDPLIREDRKVLRILDGLHFEFRHDQMRAYLAARWAACHETQPMRLFEGSAAIWRLSRKEQEEVWDFFAEMYVAEHPDNALTLWEWATADLDRGVLQHALQRALKSVGRDPVMARSEVQRIAAEADA